MSHTTETMKCDFCKKDIPFLDVLFWRNTTKEGKPWRKDAPYVIQSCKECADRENPITTA